MPKRPKKKHSRASSEVKFFYSENYLGSVLQNYNLALLQEKILFTWNLWFLTSKKNITQLGKIDKDRFTQVSESALKQKHRQHPITGSLCLWRWHKSNKTGSWISPTWTVALWTGPCLLENIYPLAISILKGICASALLVAQALSADAAKEWERV